ncbi:MAG: hypothetical protein M3310_04280, partial [Actinomycetota bacterium]|nr:hypothetical protein [Actinomycetota bacterium]
LGLRLDEPLQLRGLDTALDVGAVERLEQLELVARSSDDGGGEALALTPRGRLLGGGVTAELLA